VEMQLFQFFSRECLVCRMPLKKMLSPESFFFFLLSVYLKFWLSSWHAITRVGVAFTSTPSDPYSLLLKRMYPTILELDTSI